MIERKAIVTGASSGIGKATAVALARQGFAVAVGYHRDEAGARATADDVQAAGAHARIFALDLGEPDTAAATITAVVDELDGVGVLVNNAGVNRRCDVLEENVADWNRLLMTDLTGPFFCAQRPPAQWWRPAAVDVSSTSLRFTSMSRSWAGARTAQRRPAWDSSPR